MSMAGLVSKHLLLHWGKLRAADISRSDVKAMMVGIEAPIVANQTMAAASAIFSWAIREEFSGIKVNPCHTTTSRERVLSDHEIPLFWFAMESAGLVECMALRMILLTGQRSGEVIHMRTEHIVDYWWTLPGDPVPSLGWPGTKCRQSPGLVAEPAQRIIAEMDATGRVFAGARVARLADAMRKICTDLDVERATPHDLTRYDDRRGNRKMQIPWSARTAAALSRDTNPADVMMDLSTDYFPCPLSSTSDRNRLHPIDRTPRPHGGDSERF